MIAPIGMRVLTIGDFTTSAPCGLIRAAQADHLAGAVVVV
jgi:hypothetical protein